MHIRGIAVSTDCKGDYMHRKMPGKMVRTAVVCTVALIFALLTGCAEGTKGIEEELVSLTETRPEEVPEEEGISSSGLFKHMINT